MNAILSPICCETVIEILKYNRIGNFDICVNTWNFQTSSNFDRSNSFFFFQNFFLVSRIQIDKRSFERFEKFLMEN